MRTKKFSAKFPLPKKLRYLNTNLLATDQKNITFIDLKF